MADLPIDKNEKQVDTVPVPGTPKVEERVDKTPIPGDPNKPVKRQIELIRGNVDEVKVELLSLINTHIFQLLQEQRKTNELLGKMLETGV